MKNSRMRTRNVVALIVILVLVLQIWILISPFRFINMSYVYNIESFNKMPIKGIWNGIDLEIEIDDDAINKVDLISQKISGKDFKKNESLEEDIEMIAAVQDYLVSSSEGQRLRSEITLFDEDSDLKEICSESSKITVGLAQMLDYPARVIWTQGHTLSEIYDDDLGWILVDNSMDFVFFDKDNQLMSLAEVMFDYDNVVAAKVVGDSEIISMTEKGYKYWENRDIEPRRDIFDNNDILVVLEGEKLFSFAHEVKDLNSISKMIFGLDSISNGVQLVMDDKKLGNLGVNVYQRFAK